MTSRAREEREKKVKDPDAIRSMNIRTIDNARNSLLARGSVLENKASACGKHASWHLCLVIFTAGLCRLPCTGFSKFFYEKLYFN